MPAFGTALSGNVVLIPSSSWASSFIVLLFEQRRRKSSTTISFHRAILLAWTPYSLATPKPWLFVPPCCLKAYSYLKCSFPCFRWIVVIHVFLPLPGINYKTSLGKLDSPGFGEYCGLRRIKGLVLKKSSHMTSRIWFLAEPYSQKNFQKPRSFTPPKDCVSLRT